VKAGLCVYTSSSKGFCVRQGLSGDAGGGDHPGPMVERAQKKLHNFNMRKKVYFIL